MTSWLARQFLERVAIAFAVAALGYEASEPPRGVAWIARIRTQQKGTYNDFLTYTNFFLFLGGSVDERAQEIKDGTTESNMFCF